MRCWDLCYSCSRQLISDLTTEVKLYICAGVKKMALQCKECSMKYNTVQVGNKHQVGLQFYHEDQGTIEVTYTVSFERNLLE